MRQLLLFFFLIFLSFFWVDGQTNPIQIAFENGHVKAHFPSRGGERQFELDAIMPSTNGEVKAVLLSSDSETISCKKKICFFDHTCEITSIVKRTSYGLQWDVEIKGEGDDWTEPIETRLQWDDSKPLQFWTTWSDNHQNPETDSWQDPFLSAPFQNLHLVFGGESHVSKNAFVIPIATSFIKEDNIGLSFVQSLDDTFLNLEMHTTKDGLIAYQHLNHRISKQNTIHISHRIIFHEADWRAGLSWVMENYQGYFFPKEPLANQVAGGGAYSSYEGALDTVKYKQMGFSVNWKASLDFPYMGLFIPPVKTDDELWTKYRQAGVKVGDGYASINRLNEYSEKLKRMGFHTISYFNVTEFGNGMVYPFHEKENADEVWKDPNRFVFHHFKQALLKPTGELPSWDERPVFSNWEDCIVLDPGDSTYQSFLLNQAKLHVDKIPASAGICIDRMDWLRFFNSNADDGLSMVQNQKTRSLIMSWKDIMGKLGPIMHHAHKVIFCNPLDRRIDLMQEVDGVYDEFGYLPSSLNLCAQMALMKPIISWTVSKENFGPNPDAYFQQHLYLGAFLTVPFPGNDHSIKPDVEAEKYYLDYGPLFLAIKGREWVMVPHVVEIEGGQAKANVFKVSGKIIVPVVLGGNNLNALVKLKIPFAILGKKKFHIKLLYPGEKKWVDMGTKKFAEETRLTVPLKRGCALISLE